MLYNMAVLITILMQYQIILIMLSTIFVLITIVMQYGIAVLITILMQYQIIFIYHIILIMLYNMAVLIKIFI